MQKLKTVYLTVFLALISSFYCCGEDEYTVGGSVTGLTGTLVLTNNGTDDLSITDDETFTFSTSMKDASTYLVAVKTQPSGQNCTVAQGAGTIASADITDVSVNCSSSPLLTPAAVFSYIQHDTIPETGDRVIINNGGELIFQDTDLAILPECEASVSFRISNVGEGELESASTPVITITEGAFAEFSIPALPEFPIPAGSYKDYLINWHKFNCLASAASRVTIKTNDPEYPDFSFTVINAYS